MMTAQASQQLLQRDQHQVCRAVGRRVVRGRDCKQRLGAELERESVRKPPIQLFCFCIAVIFPVAIGVGLGEPVRERLAAGNLTAVSVRKL
jgi:hypothetical protein